MKSWDLEDKDRPKFFAVSPFKLPHGCCGYENLQLSKLVCRYTIALRMFKLVADRDDEGKVNARHVQSRIELSSCELEVTTDDELYAVPIAVVNAGHAAAALERHNAPKPTKLHIASGVRVSSRRRLL